MNRNDFCLCFRPYFMKGGAWKNERTYVYKWLTSILKIGIVGAVSLGDSMNPESYQAGQIEEDELATYIEEKSLEFPTIGQMVRVVDKVEKDRRQVGDKTIEVMKGELERRSKGEMTDEELDLLMKEEEQTDIPLDAQSGLAFRGIVRMSKGKQVAVDEEDEEAREEYPESFASQHETAQLREDFEGLSEKMGKLEEQVLALLKERESIPIHLDTIKEDVNRQLTLMMDKLTSGLEADLTPSSLQAAITSVQELKHDTVERLSAAKSYASAPPKSSSPLATTGVDLKGKRRFKPIK
jgi:ribosomal protein S15P/S13E